MDGQRQRGVATLLADGGARVDPRCLRRPLPVAEALAAVRRPVRAALPVVGLGCVAAAGATGVAGHGRAHPIDLAVVVHTGVVVPALRTVGSIEIGRVPDLVL